ncbi:MAG: hypothetical protein HYX69_13015 [Planctomycetia bacterium]|nr:hypothetical protein [Planctomycetia bacterium]
MKLRMVALVVASVAWCCGCGPSDKDYTPPPPSENVQSPPPGGTEENPGQPRP